MGGNTLIWISRIILGFFALIAALIIASLLWHFIEQRAIAAVVVEVDFERSPGKCQDKLATTIRNRSSRTVYNVNIWFEGYQPGHSSVVFDANNVEYDFIIPPGEVRIRCAYPGKLGTSKGNFYKKKEEIFTRMASLPKSERMSLLPELMDVWGELDWHVSTKHVRFHL